MIVVEGPVELKVVVGPLILMLVFPLEAMAVIVLVVRIDAGPEPAMVVISPPGPDVDIWNVDTVG